MAEMICQVLFCCGKLVHFLILKYSVSSATECGPLLIPTAHFSAGKLTQFQEGTNSIGCAYSSTFKFRFATHYSELVANLVQSTEHANQPPDPQRLLNRQAEEARHQTRNLPVNMPRKRRAGNWANGSLWTAARELVSFCSLWLPLQVEGV